MQLEAKMEKLKKVLSGYQNFSVMFSGGIDSSVLVYVCQKFFPEKLTAITILSPTLSSLEEQRIDKVIKQLAVEHEYLVSPELENTAFTRNDKNRCYYCKKARIVQLKKWAAKKQVAVLLDGSNTDDLQDYRPGMLAAQEFPELLVSPFLIAEINKTEIRALGKQLGIEFWDLPSSACLASRIAYGLEITAERLHQVEQAESYLTKIITGTIRVRHHGELARIEVATEDFSLVNNSETRKLISTYFKRLGFMYVTLDLQGYQLGSMNRVIAR